MSSRDADRRAPLRILLLGALLSGLVPASAHANDKALAESLFMEGKSLMAAGKVAEACPKFAESQRQDPSVGTLLNLARCYEDLGKTASAWAEYKEAASLARTVGDTERGDAAVEFAKKIEPRLSKLRIDAPSSIAGLRVTRDGVELGPAALGVAVAVDPGEHVVAASAPGFKPFRGKVTVGPEKDQQLVQVPALEPEAGAGATTEPHATGGNSGMRTAAYVAGGLGVAALGVGAVMGGLAAGDASEAKKLCPTGACDAKGWDVVQRGQGRALVSTIGLSMGAAALGAGVVLFLLSRAPAKEDGAARALLVPSFGPQGGGASLIGSF
jgi:hypothetical protein